MSITDTIRRGLAATGMTQVQIAEASGTTQRTVSEFLRGAGCSSANLDRFAEFLEAEIKLPKNIRKRIEALDR